MLTTLCFASFLVVSTADGNHFGKDGQFYVGGSSAFSVGGQSISAVGPTQNSGTATFQLNAGRFLKGGFALGAAVDFQANFGTNPDLIGLTLGPAASVAVHLTPSVYFWPTVQLGYGMVNVSSGPISTTEHGLAYGANLAVVIELGREVGLTLGPNLTGLFLPAQNGSTVSINDVTYTFGVGLVVWPGSQESQTET